MITYHFNINCQEPRMLISDMEFVSGDTGAYCLNLTFYDNGKRLDLSDKVLAVKGKRADGKVIHDDKPTKHYVCSEKVWEYNLSNKKYMWAMLREQADMGLIEREEGF